MAHISYKDAYEAVLAEYEGMPSKSQIAKFRQAYSDYTRASALASGLTAEQAAEAADFARLATDRISGLLADIETKAYLGFAADVDVIQERAHCAYRAGIGKPVEYTKRRQRIAESALYMDDDMISKIEAMIAEKQAAEKAAWEAIKQEA